MERYSLNLFGTAKTFLQRLFVSRRERARRAFGRPRDETAWPGDIENTAQYAAHRIGKGCLFAVDDITFEDLSIQDVFEQINHCSCTSGDQVLYWMLRCPAVTREEYARRKEALEFIETHPGLRLKLQVLLRSIGRRRDINPSEIFAPQRKLTWVLPASLVLVLLLTVAVVLAALGVLQPAAIVPVLIINPFFHAACAHVLETELPNVRYVGALHAAALRMLKTARTELDEIVPGMSDAVRSLSNIRSASSFSLVSTNDFAMIANAFFLTDLITFGIMRTTVSMHPDEVALLHDGIGFLDAVISVASFRKYASGKVCDPEIDFSENAPLRLCVRDVVHPLLMGSCVPNSIDTDSCVLLTGSNASGKSTFLESVALSALLAQSICTAMSSSYQACCLRLYSAIAHRGSVQSGDSYYIAEIRSLKRILDAVKEPGIVLAVIDEILRGTNTVERVAGSSRILASLACAGTLCFAATHDMELCSLLSGYRQCHFEETVSDSFIRFDYLLKEGPAQSRNAIRLLDLFGFDRAIIDGAENMSRRFLETGTWTTARADEAGEPDFASK